MKHLAVYDKCIIAAWQDSGRRCLNPSEDSHGQIEMGWACGNRWCLRLGVPFTLGHYSHIPCLVIDCLLVASICYYSTTHLHLLLLSCRWQSSRRMRAQWTVLKTRSQTSALISEEPGREGGSQVALVEREKVQPWTSFRLHLLPIWAIFWNWNIFSKNDM